MAKYLILAFSIGFFIASLIIATVKAEQIPQRKTIFNQTIENLKEPLNITSEKFQIQKETRNQTIKFLEEITKTNEEI